MNKIGQNLRSSSVREKASKASQSLSIKTPLQSIRLLLLFFIFYTSLEADEAKNPPPLMLYYSSHCPYSYKVLSYLNKIGKAIPMKDVSKNASAKEELLKIGGIAQVPCLIINGKALYDADAIIDWLSKNQNILLPKKQGYDILTFHANRSLQTT